MKIWLSAIGAALLGVCGSLCSAANTKPNIVYILADDMGYSDAGFMGCKDIRTPHLDALAKEAMVMDSFYVQPVCSPTRASLMSGRYVSHTGVYTTVDLEAKWGLPLQERTLANALHDGGYETAIVGKWHLGKSTVDFQPIHRGFDHQYGNWYGLIDYFTHMRGGVLDWHRDDQISHDEGYSTFLDSKEAIQLIKQKKEDQPLFLYLAYNAVHSPFQAPKEYLDQYSNLKGKRARYAADVAAMDDAIQQVIDALKEKGIIDNTLIIFSSDNGGPAPGVVTENKPLRAGKGTIYEGGVRVCGFVHWPGHVPVGHTNEMMHAIDWYPTLVKLAGGSLDQKLPLDGMDIWPTLTEGKKSPHESLLLCGTDPHRAAIRMGDYKLLLSANDQDAEEIKGEEAATGKVQLYNLAEDIGETKDLAASQPEKVKELRAKLDEYMKTFVPRGQDTVVGDPGGKPRRKRE